MVYKNPITVDEVKRKISYNPQTGIFHWRVDAAKNVKAGTEAGCIKASRHDKSENHLSYRYIRIGHEIPASRIAWVLSYGEWPNGKLRFKDGNTLNLRIDNLELSNCLFDKYDHSDREQRNAYLREHRRIYGKTWKDSDLKRQFGISLEEYQALSDAQGHKCAICGEPETATRNGKTKMLAVDHCHSSSKIRGLLCAACNQGIGKLKDDPDILRAAARYIEASK